VYGYGVLGDGGKENTLFVKMMALVGKMTEEIQRLLPTVQGLLHGSSCELLQHGKHALDDSVLIAEQFRGLLGMMMGATAWSLGHVRCVNTLRLVCFNSIFHTFSSCNAVSSVSTSHENSPIVAFDSFDPYRTRMKTCKIASMRHFPITMKNLWILE